ncbi:hypothetical protein FRX31_016221 [Thalictrum thalictroides]|uniref:Reverse transcriptase zinc-binding domain-containing protein n=1 Tax=Thalictrum thalictroides TaxID=46969 RepID=A0A7J6WDB6_THATH|nr:hypothetical protein FRX31_016221 [Thalictrum thalictroides]
MPKRVISILEASFAGFIWGSKDGKQMRKWVAWDKITKPIEFGGLGIRPLKLILKSFRMKATWNILTSSSLWSTFMRNKYTHGKDISTISLTSTASKTWRDCWRCIQEVIDLSTWDYGPGNFSISHENWRKTGCLAPHIVPTDCDQITLQEASLVNFNLPMFTAEMQRCLREEYYQNKSRSSTDTRIWMHTTGGKFTIKSYVQLIQGNQRRQGLFRNIWNSWIPTKVSFFIWKLLKGAIPVDSAITKCHIPIVSKCLCCTQSSEETSLHLFIQSDLAKPVWAHFNDLAGIQFPRFYNIGLIIKTWMTAGKKGSMEYMCHSFIPLAILWEIWKVRCSKKFEDAHSQQTNPRAWKYLGTSRFGGS